MSRTAVIFFAWWFLMTSKGGSFAPGISMNIGPFGREADCRKIRAEVAGDGDKVTYASECWEDDGCAKALSAPAEDGQRAKR